MAERALIFALKQVSCTPLGIRGLIFDRLQPPPRDGTGVWPGSVRSWVNIADQSDVVALEKRLGTRFGDRVADVLVHNGARAHDVRPFSRPRTLTATVLAMAKRPPGCRAVVVSGDDDGTVRMWELAAAEQVGEPLENNTGEVWR
jgi:hypothetical protein